MLPGLNFSPNQLFWISGASVWCAKQRPGDLRMSVMLGTHTPADYRIKVSVFFNNYPFYTSFHGFELLDFEILFLFYGYLTKLNTIASVYLFSKNGEYPIIFFTKVANFLAVFVCFKKQGA